MIIAYRSFDDLPPVVISNAQRERGRQSGKETT